MNRLYTTHDISQLLQVDPSTVSKWIDRNILLAFRTPGGHRRVRAADLRSFLISHEMPVPDELGGDLVRLLMVDPDKALLDLTRKAFKGLGSGVDLVGTTSALEGLLLATEIKPHGLLIDLSLEDVDAVDLIRRVRAHRPLEGVRVIAMSTSKDAAKSQAAIEAGAVTVLNKPLDPNAVLELFRVPLALRRASAATG